ncbi:MAG: hypothetical protein AAFN74_11750 [Myxococcota bacterium]
MKNIHYCLLIGVALGTTASVGCTTNDPREGINVEDAQRPRGLGEQCSDMEACADGLTCFDNTCTPDAFAAACTPSPCGEGLCNARGDATVTAFCRCGGINVSTASAAAGISGFLWDGVTCVADTFPTWPGSVTPDTKCPAEELAPGVPDEETADCPDTEFTVCTAASGGDCLDVFVSLDGRIGDRIFGGSTTGGAALTEATCIREYVRTPANGDDEEEIDGAGLQLVFTGTLAASLSPGATQIVVAASNFDALSTGATVVWPQMNASMPLSDSGFVDVTITSTTGTVMSSATAGEFIVDNVSGPDVDEDDIIDDGTGVVGGEFYLGLPNGDFLSGAFTVNCGDNIVTTAP